MKKFIAFIFAALLGVSAYAEVRIAKAYAMKKDSYGIYVIRVLVEGEYHDWYVTPTDDPHVFYGYDDDEKIVVNEIIDIAIKY